MNHKTERDEALAKWQRECEGASVPVTPMMCHAYRDGWDDALAQSAGAAEPIYQTRWDNPDTVWGDVDKATYDDFESFGYAVRRIVYAAAPAPVSEPQAICQTCNGNGVIGGPSYYAPDEGGEPCPDCCDTPSLCSSVRRCTAKDAEQPSEFVAWEYSFIHSSATGCGDSKVGPCLTYDREIAYGVGCIDQREVTVSHSAQQRSERAADMRKALEWAAGTLQTIVSGRWRDVKEGDRVSIGATVKTISDVLDMADEALSTKTTQQDCPHGVDDGACKQCYDEAVRGEQGAALSDDARECLMDVVSHYDNIVAGFAAQRLNACEAGDSDNATYWTREMNVANRMKVQAERALAASVPTLSEQFEQLDVQNHAYRRAMQKIMARLTELLDEDRFAEIENIVKSLGVEPPAAPRSQAAKPKGLTEEERDAIEWAAGQAYSWAKSTINGTLMFKRWNTLCALLAKGE